MPAFSLNRSHACETKIPKCLRRRLSEERRRLITHGREKNSFRLDDLICSTQIYHSKHICSENDVVLSHKKEHFEESHWGKVIIIKAFPGLSITEELRRAHQTTALMRCSEMPSFLLFSFIGKRPTARLEVTQASFNNNAEAFSL